MSTTKKDCAHCGKPWYWCECAVCGDCEVRLQCECGEGLCSRCCGCDEDLHDD